MACDQPTQGGILFHDRRGDAPLDSRACPHGPASPARVDFFRSRALHDPPLCVFHPADVRGDPGLSDNDFAILRALRRLRVATKSSNGKGLRVVELAGGAMPDDEEPVRPEDFLERRWREMATIRAANEEAVRRLLGGAACRGPGR
jgi:hypothetical protein